MTALGNSAGNRQLKSVGDPTEDYDAVNLRTLSWMMESLRDEFQQQLQEQQEQLQQMQQQIDSLQSLVDAFASDSSSSDNFVCGTSTVTDYDGNTYNTVLIGNQCWMKENMRATKYSDGTSITQASVSQESSTTRYYYNPGQAENYGYLYNWPAAKGPSSVSANNQGICPTGWHVPSDGEWTQLTQYVGSQSNYLCSNNSTYIAKALASTTGWNSSSNTCAVGNTPASNNATGFGAVPAGTHNGSSFNYSGYDADFWSSTEYGSSTAYSRTLNYNYATVGSGYGYKYCGYSVRCLRD